MNSAVPSLSLVVLAYNEEDNVVPYLETCLRYLDELGGEHEILLVDDGSSDETAARASGLAEEDPRIRVLSHGVNRGMGAGMRTGFANARGDYVTILAADGQVLPSELDKLLPHLDSADIVLSVYARRANEIYRVAMSRGLRIYMRALLGLSFRLEGIYLFPVRVARDEIGLDTIAPQTFFFSFELISRALAMGYRARTATIQALPRQGGSSKVANLRKILGVAGEVWRFRQRLTNERRSV